MDALPLLPGLPGYDNVELIAHGTSALVFRARQIRLNRLVAIKVITSDTGGDMPVNAARELATTVALSSQPHIVSIIDTGATEDDRPYIVMEYCEGGSYAQILRQRGPLAVDEVIEVGIKIGEALHAAHEVGIVHRDVKPSNILRSRFGPALTDFGIARAPDELGSTLTREMMTPHHASPEALLHQAQSAPSDVYSLASTMWTLLTGQPPFVPAGRPTLDLFAFRDRVLNDGLPPMHRDDVPDWLMRELTRAMAKLPPQRHGTALEFAEALHRGSRGLPAMARSGLGHPLLVPHERISAAQAGEDLAPAVPPPPSNASPPHAPLGRPPVPQPLAAQTVTPRPIIPRPVTSPPITSPPVTSPPMITPSAPSTTAPSTVTPPTITPPMAASPQLIGRPPVRREAARPARTAHRDRPSPAPAGPLEARVQRMEAETEVIYHPGGRSESGELIGSGSLVETAAPPADLGGWVPDRGKSRDDRPPPDHWIEPAPPRRGARRTLVVSSAVGLAVILVIAVAALILGGLGGPKSPESGPTPLGTDFITAQSEGAPQNVKLTDHGTSVTLTWTDPTDGTVSFVVTGSPAGGTPMPLRDIGRGVTTVTYGGLDQAANYCFVVAAVYAVNHVATAPRSCTTR